MPAGNLTARMHARSRRGGDRRIPETRNGYTQQPGTHVDKKKSKNPPNSAVQFWGKR
jgi:hypothetical protein